MTATIFLGPSLPLKDAWAILPADYRPPVRQGDIYRLLLDRRPSAIAIIDGYFHEVPSVWHKEILWALDQGIPVHGAASMGALRAAELDIYGMEGHGKIYQAFKEGLYPPYGESCFEDDDEVAVIHGPADLGYPALSEALVDIRETLARANEAGVIEAEERDQLAMAFKALGYRERHWDQLTRLGTASGIAPDMLGRLEAWLPGGRVAQKRRDSEGLLARLAESETKPGAVPRTDFVFERTTLWAQFVEAIGGQRPDEVQSSEARILEELRLDPEAYEDTRRLAVMRAAALRATGVAAVEPSARRRSLDALRHRHGLWSRAGLEAWAESAGLQGPEFDRLIEAEARLEFGAENNQPDLDSAMLDLLRLDGRYPALAARALDKTEHLSAEPQGRGREARRAPTALVDWYFELRLGRPTVEDPEAFAQGLGFAALEDFVEALWREYRYLETKGPGLAAADAETSEGGVPW